MAPTLVTQVRNLQRRKARKRSSLAVAEGVRLVEEAAASGVPMHGVIVTDTALAVDRVASLVRELAGRDVPIEEVDDRVFETVADTDTPQGILAIVEPKSWQPDDIELGAGGTVLVLDGVQDPGNVGTLVRTAFALGSPGVVLLPGTADPRHPKVLRSAMGATFRLPVAVVTDEAFAAWVRRAGVGVWAATADGKPLERAERPERLALVVGNEGAGIRPFMRSLAQQRVAIPLTRGAESLNVAVAAGIVLYEVRRAK